MFQLVHMAAPVKMRTLFHCVSALHDINGPMLDMLQDITTQRCKDWGGELMEFNGEADHVHALVSLPPNPDLSRFVNNLKTTSSPGAPRIHPPAQSGLSQAGDPIASSRAAARRCPCSSNTWSSKRRRNTRACAGRPSPPA